jgi:hypothetical protein
MADAGASPGQVVTAQGMSQPLAGQPTVDKPAVGQAARTVGPAVDSQLLNDPGRAYTQEVQAVLLDAIVESSGPLDLGDDDWLTIAARDNAPSNPLMTGDPNVKTLVLRVKGGDLAAFQAGHLTAEQVRSRVQVGEF